MLPFPLAGKNTWKLVFHEFSNQRVPVWKRCFHLFRIFFGNKHSTKPPWGFPCHAQLQLRSTGIIRTHLFYLHFIAQLSKVGSGKPGKSTCHAWWEWGKQSLLLHQCAQHLCAPHFKSCSRNHCAGFVCSTALIQTNCSPRLPGTANKSWGGCSSGVSVRSSDLPGTQPGWWRPVSLFPLHICSPFLSLIESWTGKH